MVFKYRQYLQNDKLLHWYKILNLLNFLALGAEVGAALAEHNALNWRAAARAGFACTLVDLEIVLEIASLIDPIDAGPITANALLKHRANRVKQGI